MSDVHDKGGDDGEQIHDAAACVNNEEDNKEDNDDAEDDSNESNEEVNDDEENESPGILLEYEPGLALDVDS
jgi:hypothetical protein